MPAMLTLITLGGLTVRGESAPPDTSRVRKPLALLAVVAAGTTAGISRDRLQALFWPESDAERARGGLKQALYAIRQTLSVDPFSPHASNVVLDRAVLSADFTQFEGHVRAGELDAAVALYNGPFLDGVYLKDVPEFERWVETERSRLAGMCGRALELLAAGAAERQDFSAAVDWRRRRVEIDRLDGRSELLYMEALAAAGDPETAIRHASIHCKLVRAELDEEPDEEVLELAEQLRVLPARTPAKPMTRMPVPDDNAAAPPTTTGEIADARLATPLAALPRLRSRSVAMALVVAALAFAAYVAIRVRYPPVIPGTTALVVQAPAGDTALSRLASLSRGQLSLQISRFAPMLLLRPSPDQPARDDRDPISLARSSRAEHVVLARFRRAGERVVVELQLLDTQSGHVLLQAEITSAPAATADSLVGWLPERAIGMVRVFSDSAVGPWLRAGANPPTLAAFEEFARGLDVVRGTSRAVPEFVGSAAAFHGTAVGWEQEVAQEAAVAVEHFARAARLDTSFIAAKIWLIDQADRLPNGRGLVDSVVSEAMRQRGRLSEYDRLYLDRELAHVRGDVDAVYGLSKRLLALAPDAADAQVGYVDASMAARHYGAALAELQAIDRSRGALAGISMLDKWELEAHHVRGEFDAELTVWRAMAAKHPDDYFVCVLGMAPYAARGMETQVDSLADACARMGDGPGLIPLRSLVDFALPEYLAHGYPAAARRALERVTPRFVELGKTQAPKRMALGAKQTAMADWAAARRSYTPPPGMESDYFFVTNGVIAVHLGDTLAVNRTRRAIAGWAQTRYTHGADAAAEGLLALAAGDTSYAIGDLRVAMRLGASPERDDWYHDIRLTALRANPRFKAILAEQP